MKRGMNFLVLNLVLSLFIAVFVVSLPFSSASVYPGNNSLVLTKTKYTVNDTLQGKINVSIINESGDNTLNYNSQSVSLIQFLMNSSLNIGVDYFCSTQFCQDTYRTPTYSRPDITLSSGYIGLLVSGTNIEIINPPSFVVKGSIDTQICSYQTPLQIDLLDDGVIDYKYLKAGDFCSELRKSPCYRLDLTSSFDEQSVTITSNGYCQEIDPPMSSRFMIYVNKTKRGTGVAAGTGKLKLSMYYSSYDGDVIKESSCSPNEPGETYGMINCSVDFAVSGEPGGNYYLCIKDEKQQSNENYAIMRQKKEPKCGYSEIPLSYNGSTPTGNYPLFYQAASIASFNRDEKINLSEIIKFRGDIDLIYDINAYLFDNYGSDCSNYEDLEYPNCILPIKISATSPVTFSNFIISWYDDGTPISSSDYTNIFSIEKKAPKVSTSRYKSIEINNANFLVPSEYRKYNFSLFLGGIKLGDNGFEVTDVPSISRIEPLEVFAGTSTTFTSTVSSRRKIISYKWDFGDGNSQTTDKKTVLHVYSEIGEFNLSLTVMDNESVSSTQIVVINVLSPKEKIPSIISHKLDGIKNVEGSISTLSWQQNYIRNQINSNEIKQLLIELNESYNHAKNDSEYLDIVIALNEIDAPLSLNILKYATNFPYLHKRAYIDVSKLSQIGLGEYSLEGEDLIKDQVLVWELGKANVKIDNKFVSLTKESGEQELATIFDLRIKGTYENPVYVLLPYSEVYSSVALSKKNGTSYSYIKLDSLSDNSISFMLSGKVNLEEFRIIISPSFENLGIIVNASCNANDICEKDLGENSKNCRYDCKPYGLAITWIILLLVMGVIVWIIIQDYYNNRYETHLFKNKHDLDNLKLFITTSKTKGTKDKEIKVNLKKAGWESEQIEYAFLSLEKQTKQVSQPKSATPAVLNSKVPQTQQTQANKQTSEQPRTVFKRPFFRRFK